MEYKKECEYKLFIGKKQGDIYPHFSHSESLKSDRHTDKQDILHWLLITFTSLLRYDNKMKKK